MGQRIRQMSNSEHGIFTRRPAAGARSGGNPFHRRTDVAKARIARLVSHAESDRKALGPLALLAVAILVLWTAVEVLSGFALAAHSSEFGFSVEPNGTVDSVAPNSAAAAAGIRQGDRLELDKLSARQQLTLHFYKVPGTQLAVVVDRAGRTAHGVVLESRAAAVKPGDWFALVAVLVVACVFVGIATALVMLKPTATTWGFFFFACGYSIVQFGAVQAMLPPPWSNVHAALLAFAMLLTIGGAARFTARFPDEPLTGVSALYERTLFAAMPIVAVLYALTLALGGELRLEVLRIYFVMLLLILAAAIALIVWKQRSGSASERARGRWVLAGSGLAIASLLVDLALHLLGIPGFPGSPLDVALGLVIVLIPISVAYAVLREHVIDVRFAINRALVYGSFTSLLVLAFTAIEWFIGKELSDERVAGYVEVAAALAIGFWFNLLHKRAERFFDRVFFRQQHSAERHLARVASATPHAPSIGAVDHFLVTEPQEAYNLVSAALFRRNGTGEFALDYAAGWPDDALKSIREDDPLPIYLAAENNAIDLDDISWSPAGLPPGSAQPLVAVPVSVRHRLMGIALYSATEDGEALDPDQRRMLERLATAAAAAYDHLEAESVRSELDLLRGEIAALRGGPAPLSQPAPS
jgi:hypothetical protein